MTIGDQNLTDLDVKHVQSAPGMAHFAGTGPRGKTCGDCIFWGYSKIDKNEKVKYRDGCKKYFLLTERHGPKISPKLLSCKYFDDKDKNKNVCN